MRIELSPSRPENNRLQTYTAMLFRDSELIAEITEAPHDIARQWAEIMRDLHEGMPEIKRLGVCLYCGSTQRVGEFCGDCDRVFRS